MKTTFTHSFEDITSLENLLAAWSEFVIGKRLRKDVLFFQSRLMDNLIELQSDLANQRYTHGGYEPFMINDPKPRSIHKASVRDRIVHRAIYRQLYPFFDRTFIADSFSCRVNKGTHKALARFEKFGDGVSKNSTRTCWVLKCDIRKFFDSIDHHILLGILESRIADQRILELIRTVVKSYHKRPGVGLPLGNLTSQLLVNIYMNEFDQFVKHRLRAKYYVRYADDFILMSPDRSQLENWLSWIDTFLVNQLRLNLHPDKVFIKTLASGVDFLGWVHFPGHRILRPTTKRRMLKRLSDNPTDEVIASYLGLLSHGQTYHLRHQIKTLEPHT